MFFKQIFKQKVLTIY